MLFADELTGGELVGYGGAFFAVVGTVVNAWFTRYSKRDQNQFELEKAKLAAQTERLESQVAHAAESERRCKLRLRRQRRELTAVMKRVVGLEKREQENQKRSDATIEKLTVGLEEQTRIAGKQRAIAEEQRRLKHEANNKLTALSMGTGVPITPIDTGGSKYEQKAVDATPPRPADDEQPF